MADKQQPPQLPSPDVVREFVSIGLEQIRVRKQELELEEKDSQRNFDFATKALAVQAEDRRDSRVTRRKRDIDRYVFVGILFLLVVGFILMLAHMGKDDLAKEVFKLAVTFLTGGISGYSLGKLRARRESESEDNGTDTNR